MDEVHVDPWAAPDVIAGDLELAAGRVDMARTRVPAGCWPDLVADELVDELGAVAALLATGSDRITLMLAAVRLAAVQRLVDVLDGQLDLGPVSSTVTLAVCGLEGARGR